MAKKGSRILIGLVCQECKSHNYTKEKNKVNHPEKLELLKYCKHCRKRTKHKEVTKLK